MILRDFEAFKEILRKSKRLRLLGILRDFKGFQRISRDINRFEVIPLLLFLRLVAGWVWKLKLMIKSAKVYVEVEAEAEPFSQISKMSTKECVKCIFC